MDLACCRLLFSYEVLTPAALNFFVSYAGGAVESLWSIDQYFEFVLVLMLSTGLSFQVCLMMSAVLPATIDDTPAGCPVIKLYPQWITVQVPVLQVLLGQTGIITSKQFFSVWKWVVVGATLAAAILTPSTDPFTQTLLAIPLIGLYMGGAGFVRLIEARRLQESS